MSLRHLPTNYTTRKNIYEAAIVRRRNHDIDFRDAWQKNAKYFNKYDVHTTKQEAWQSKQSFQHSMDAYKAIQEADKKEKNLKRRRHELAEMLRKERDQYEAELKGISPDNYSRLEEMKDRSETLRSAREEKRKVLAEELMYEHWRQNNPDIRKLESDQHKDHVVHMWGDQVDDKVRQAEVERQNKEEYERYAEEQRLAALEIQKQQEMEKLQEEKDLQIILKKQVTELKDREQEAAKLKMQQELLMKQQWELEQLEEQRKGSETARKNKEHGRILLRQHAAALRRKTRQIMEELDQDKKFLEELIKQEALDQEIKTARREKARTDAAWFKGVIEDQLKLEKAREAELDQLYQEEAARVWQQREADWARERQARERLMQEVLNARQEQIQDKMEAVRQQQEESIERREELLRDMEIAQQLTHREERLKEEAKELQKEELEAQMTERRDQEERLRLRLRLEEDEEQEAEKDYEEMLRKEAEKLSVRGYTPKPYGRKQAWT